MTTAIAPTTNAGIEAERAFDFLRTDPQFEEEFRRVPPDAPPGTKTRFERISDELKK